MAVAQAIYYVNEQKLEANTVTNPPAGMEVLSMAIAFREDMEIGPQATAALIDIMSRPSTLNLQSAGVELDNSLFRPKV